MRAVIIPRPGGPEVLELREVPDPPFGAEEVLVRVRASAMNRADLLQRRGLYPAPPAPPRTSRASRWPEKSKPAEPGSPSCARETG